MSPTSSTTTFPRAPRPTSTASAAPAAPGRAGEAITLVTPREVRWLRQIERITRARIEPRRLPTLADVAERRRDALKQQIRAVLDTQDDGYAGYLDTINDLADEHDAAEIAAAILKLYAEETGRTTTPEQQEDDIATFAAVAPPARGPRGEAGMVRLFLNVGRNQGARPQDFVGAIANEAGIPGRAIGAIDIFDDYTFVDIPREFVDRVLAAMRGARIKGRPVNAEVARMDGAPGPRDRGGRGPASVRTATVRRRRSRQPRRRQSPASPLRALRPSGAQRLTSLPHAPRRLAVLTRAPARARRKRAEHEE